MIYALARSLRDITLDIAGRGRTLTRSDCGPLRDGRVAEKPSAGGRRDDKCRRPPKPVHGEASREHAKRVSRSPLPAVFSTFQSLDESRARRDEDSVTHLEPANHSTDDNLWLTIFVLGLYSTPSPPTEGHGPGSGPAVGERSGARAVHDRHARPGLCRGSARRQRPRTPLPRTRAPRRKDRRCVRPPARSWLVKRPATASVKHGPAQKTPRAGRRKVNLPITVSGETPETRAERRPAPLGFEGSPEGKANLERLKQN